MHCCKNALEHGLQHLSARLFALILSLCLSLGAGLAHAGSIEASRAALSLTEDGYALSADFVLDLSQPLEDAISHGVTLFFVVEFDLTRPRWYWSNEHVAGRKISYRLSYNALTRQYRLSNSSLNRNFSTLNEALRALSRISQLQITDKNTLKYGETYTAALRLALDRSQLPKPFQLDAIANRDWQVDAKTLRWSFTPGAEAK